MFTKKMKDAPTNGTPILAICNCHGFKGNKLVIAGSTVEIIYWSKASSKWKSWTTVAADFSTHTPDPICWWPVPASVLSKITALDTKQRKREK